MISLAEMILFCSRACCSCKRERKKKDEGEDRATKVCTRAQTSGWEDASSTAWSSPKRSPPSTATSISTDYFLFPLQLHTEFCNKSAHQGWQLCALQLRLSHQRHLKPTEPAHHHDVPKTLLGCKGCSTCSSAKQQPHV